jgi:predicted Zn-dependent protease
MESEADRVGIELAAKAGYNPNAAVTLWDKMASFGGAQPEFLSTHPSPASRKQELQALVPVMQGFDEHARH